MAILERMVDWKGVIEPYLKRKYDALTSHTNPHYFKFNLHDNTPMMQWKYYSMWIEKIYGMGHSKLPKDCLKGT